MAHAHHAACSPVQVLKRLRSSRGDGGQLMPHRKKDGGQFRCAAPQRSMFSCSDGFRSSAGRQEACRPHPTLTSAL